MGSGPEALSMGWWVYILRCADDTLYTGCNDDVEKRCAAHNSGKGAKYTRGRGPVTVVYREACESRSAALRREAAVKKLSRAEKWRLILCARTTKNALPEQEDRAKIDGNE